MGKCQTHWNKGKWIKYYEAQQYNILLYKTIKLDEIHIKVYTNQCQKVDKMLKKSNSKDLQSLKDKET